MSSATIFIASVLVTAALGLLIMQKKNPGFLKSLITTREGKGILKGPILFVLFGIAVVLISLFASKAFSKSHDEGRWFAYGEVFLGLDVTNKQSPMCEDGDNSSRLTSNGGLRVNVYQSADQLFEWNQKYTHHSCAFNVDDKSYDALGWEFSYKFWGK